MHVSGDRASENADAVGATNNIKAVGTNVCAARSSGNYLLPVGSRSRLRAYTAIIITLSRITIQSSSIYLAYKLTLTLVKYYFFRWATADSASGNK